MSKTYYSEFYPTPSTSGVQGTTLPATRNVPRGDWSSLGAGTQLNVGDMVTYNGSSYSVIVAHIKGTAPDSSGNFQLLASAGSQGPAGTNNALVYIFQRATSTPTLPSGTTSYTFANASLSGLNNGWSQIIPVGTDPIYVSIAVASSSGSTDNISSAEWASPVIMSQNGATGPSGANAAIVFLYQRNTTGIAPTAPASTLTYTFSTALISGTLGSWTQTIPSESNGPFLFITTAAALSVTDTDNIATGEWATVRRLSQDAQNIVVSSNIQTIPYNTSTPVDGTATITFTATRLNNASATITWSITRLDGTATGVSLSGSGITTTLTHANFDTARGLTEGIIVGASITVGGITYTDKISVVRAVKGSTGADAKTVTLGSSRQGIYYNSAGAATPASQTTVFTANRQNTSNSATWSITDLNGVVQSAAYLTNQTATTCDLTEPNFALARNGTGGVIVTATITDGTTFSDRISVLKVDQGATGATGPTLDISTPTGQFIMVDGVLNPASQTITVSATVANVATAVTWNIRQPNGTLIRTAGPATSVGVTQTDLGSNESLIIQGVYDSTTIATVNLERKYALSSDYLSAISYTRSNALDSGGTLLNAAANGVLTRDEKRTRIVPEWTTIQASYVRYQAEATARGITTEKTTHSNAYNALSIYLNVSTSILNTGHATAIDTTEFTNSFKNYYDAEAALVTACNNAAATTATWSAITGSSKPADNAGTTVSLVALSPISVDIAGNKITNVAGGWQVFYSREAFKGAAYASCRFSSGNTQIFGLLANIPTLNGDPNGVGLTIYTFEGNLTLFIGGGYGFESGFGFITSDDVLSVQTNDVNVIFSKNGVPFKTIPLSLLGISAGATYRAGGQLLNGTISNVLFGASSNDSWSNVVGTGKPEDYATVGAPSGTTVDLAAYFGNDGQTVSYERNRTQRLTQAGRGNDGRFLNSNNNFGLRSLNDNPVFTDTDNTGSVTINIPAMTLYPDWGGSITFPSGSVATLAYNTRYFIYRNQADPSTTGESWGVTTDLLNALGTGKVYVGTLLTRASAGAPAPPPPPPPNYDGNFCVVCEAFVPTTTAVKRASEISEEDKIIILDESTMNDITNIAVESNEIGTNAAVTLITQTGITLTLSQNTPITLQNGNMILALNCTGYQVPVLDNSEFRWEIVEKVIPVGLRKVSRLRCYQSVYAAGNEKDRYILTHNPTYDKP